MKILTRIIGSVAASLIGMISPTDSMVRRLPIREIVQKSDPIILGRVVGVTYERGAAGKMIFTIVELEVSRVIVNRSGREVPSRLTLTFAGGTIDEESIHVSDVPRLEANRSYLLCIHDDGVRYASPVVGGYQGIFEVITDPSTGQRFPLAPGRHGIESVVAGEMNLTDPVAGFDKGAAKYGTSAPEFVAPQPPPAPSLVDPPSGGSAITTVVSARPSRLLELEEFIGVIRELGK